MEELNYQQQAMVGATGIELILALYDGALRNLYRAKQCTLDHDVHERRIAVKKAVDIFMYLQARLRPDVGGEPAVALSDFYSAMFTMVLEASHGASVVGFDAVIACVKNVRDAWAVVALDPEAGKVLPRELRTREEKFRPGVAVPADDLEQPQSMKWSA